MRIDFAATHAAYQVKLCHHREIIFCSISVLVADCMQTRTQSNRKRELI